MSEELSTGPLVPRPPARSKYPLLPGSPCQLGDVVLKATGDEAWLAGALVFEEDTLSSVLFYSPDRKGELTVFARLEAGAPLLWLRPLPAIGTLVGRDPPGALEWEGLRFERVRRLPLRARVVGSGAPSIGSTAIVSEYRTPGSAVLLVAVGSEKTISYVGEVLNDGLYEVIASGKRTLEDGD